MIERLRRWRNKTISGIVCMLVFKLLLFPVVIVVDVLLFAFVEERNSRRWSTELHDWWLHL